MNTGRGGTPTHLPLPGPPSHEGANDAGGTFGLLRGDFLLLVASSFLFLMSSYLVVPMLPRYLGTIGAAEAELGFIMGLLPMAAVFTRIPVGVFIDRNGRRGMLMTGIALQAASPFLYTLCTDASQFMAVRALNGLGFAAYAVTTQTIVVDLSPKRRLGEVLGLYTMCFLSAQAVGPSVSGLLLSGFGYTATFYASGVMGLAATLLALRVTVPSHVQSVRQAGDFRAVLCDRNLATTSLALVMLTLPYGVVYSFFPVYAASCGIGPEGVGFFFTVYALSMAGVRPFIGALSDRIDRAKVTVPFALVAACGVGSFAITSDLAGFLASGVLLGTGIGAVQSVLSALSVDTVPPALWGQAVAVSTTASDAGICVGAFAMGPMVAGWGYPVAFVAAAGVVVAGAAAFVGSRAVWKKDEKTCTGA